MRARFMGSQVEVARLGVPPYERFPLWEGFTSRIANEGERDAGAANKQALAV